MSKDMVTGQVTASKFSWKGRDRRNIKDGG